MFGGPPPPPSKAELEAAELESNRFVQQAVAGGIILYLSPFVIDYVRNLV